MNGLDECGELEAFGIGVFDINEAYDAAHECVHGRLPIDASPPCGCWPQEITKSTPVVVTATTVPTTTEKEPRIMEQPESVDAPFGLKPDGTPRKRPAPSPEQIRAMQAGRGKGKAKRVTAVKAPTVTATPGPAIADSPFVAQMVGTIDIEIARLERMRTAIVEAAA